MRRKFLILSVLFIIFFNGSISAIDLNYYIPEGINKMNPAIPTPMEYFGFEIGQQYISYDQTVSYLNLLAQKSDRIKIIQNGYSYERKPLISLLISSKKNFANIENIRKNHLELCNPDKSGKINVDSLPLITWLCYSIHGNEASGINASVVVSYILAASDNDFINNVLENNVIILQPSLNPDGVQKYATWVNSNMSYSQNSDENSREFHEPEPSSRLNHYWSDLNRDWLFVQHPESYYRMELFYKWMPTLVNDYHERENTSGSFFSPGEKNSTNLLIPDENWAITNKISKYHSEILNAIGTLYFSKEGYDDFYTGKGATLSDLIGGIGILYEQPNPKGFVRKKENVEIRFVDIIRNQVYCSISALKAAYEMKNELLNYQRNFFIEKRKLADRDQIKGYVFGSESDISTTKELIRILNIHNIMIYKLSKTIKLNENIFDKDYSYVVPCKQQNYSIIKTIFDKVTTFKDSIFYDVTTWTIPLALNINYAELRDINNLIGEQTDSVITKEVRKVSLTNFAYLFELNDYYSYSFLYYLQNNGIKLKVADSPFTFNIGEIEHHFNPGTIMIPVKEQSCSIEEINKIINNYSGKIKIPVFAVNNGNGTDCDLGSPHFKRISKPVVAILISKKSDFSAIGELWHLLDFRFGIPVSLIDVDNLGKINLYKYNTIVLTDSFNLTNEISDKLVSWASNNTLIIMGTAYKTTNNLGFSDINLLKDISQKDSITYGIYSDYIEHKNNTTINGVILNAEIDLTHPIAYGLSNENIPLFKNGNIIISNPKSRFVTPIYYSDKPLLSGFIQNKYLNMIKGTPAVLAGNNLIYFVDNPYFRSCWLGSSRLFLNSLFFRELLAKEKVLTYK